MGGQDTLPEIGVSKMPSWPTGRSSHPAAPAKILTAAVPEERPEVFDIATVIDHGVWQPRQKFILMLASLVAMVDGVDAQVLSLALPMVAKDWGVPPSAFSILMALSFVAMAVGAVVGGYAGDRLGRRTTLIGATVAFGAFTLASAFSQDLLGLGLMRSLAALGLGAATPNVATIAAEFTPIRHRSLALGIAMSALPVGGIVLGLLSAYILPRHGWEVLFLVAGALTLLVALLLLALIPESPRFLVRSQSNAPKIARIISSMHVPHPTIVHFVDTGEIAPRRRAPVSAIFAGTLARDTCLIGAASFFVVFSTYLVYTWAPLLLTNLGYSGAFIGTGLSCFSAGGLVSGVIGAQLVQRIGSRPALFGMSVTGIVCAVMMAVLIRSTHGSAAGWMLLGLTFAGLIPGLTAVIYVLAGQIYPAAIRATGVGVVAGVGRFGAVTSAFVGPLVLYGHGTPFFLVTAGAMFAVAVALFAVRHRIEKQEA